MIMFREWSFLQELVNYSIGEKNMQSITFIILVWSLKNLQGVPKDTQKEENLSLHSPLAQSEPDPGARVINRLCLDPRWPQRSASNQTAISLVTAGSHKGTNFLLLLYCYFGRAPPTVWSTDCTCLHTTKQ